MYCQRCGNDMGDECVCPSCGYRYREEKITRRLEPEPKRVSRPILRSDSPAVEFLKETGTFALKVVWYTFLGIVLFIVVIIALVL